MRKSGKAISIPSADFKPVIELPDNFIEKKKKCAIAIKTGIARGLEWYFMVRRMDLNVLFTRGKKEKPKPEKKRKSRGFQ